MSAGCNIGQAAQASGLSAKMIRHYEAIGLIGKTLRSESGYRRYSESELHTLRFIKQARTLGFSIKQIEALLGLWQNQSRSSSQVKTLALEHIVELEQKIVELQSMKATLAHLVQGCRGDARPECPILDELAGQDA